MPYVGNTSQTIFSADDVTVTDDLTVTDDATIGGTLGVTGVVTANAGVVVDNITIDGNDISTTDSNGSLTLSPNGTGDVVVNTDKVIILATEGESATLMLVSDESDDNADDWQFFANASDNTLAIQNDISGSAVTHLSMTPNATVANSTAAFAGNVTVDRKLSVSAADGVADADYVGSFKNLESTGARSFGVSVQAGSTSSDIALNVINTAADTVLFRVKGGGQCVVGNTLTLDDGELFFANGHGISFAATSDTGGMINEILDDYEEGTFTPTINFQNSTNNSAASVNAATGRYTKIGNVVTFSIRLNIVVPGSLATDNFSIQSLPFASENISLQDYVFSPAISGVSTDTPLIFFLQNNQSLLFLSNIQGGGNGGSLLVTGNTVEINVSGSYRSA